MSRIRPDRESMKIEHWQSQARYPDRQLDYANLLGACLGGEGQPAIRQHCDTRKGDKDLKWNPANPDHRIQNRVRYEPDGSVRANDRDFDEQIDDVLNLNLPVLKNKRKAVLDSVLDWVEAPESSDRRPRATPTLGSKTGRVCFRRRGTGTFLPSRRLVARSASRKDVHMTTSRHSEAAFETVIEAHLFQTGYVSIPREGFDRDRAIFPNTVLAFIRETQPVEWAKLEALHGDKTGEQILTDLCKWMDANGSLATPAPRLQVLRADAPRGILQGGSRTEPRTRSPLRSQPARAHSPTPFLPSVGEITRRNPEPKRHPHRHDGAQKPTHRANGRECDPPVPARPRPPRSDLRVQTPYARPFCRRY